MANEASRFNAGKLPLSMVLEARYALEGAAEVLAFGAEKYERSNWQKGMPKEEVMDSLLRHLAAYARGEENDQESGLNHLDHVLCNAIFLADQYNGRRDGGRKPTKISLEPHRGDDVVLSDIGLTRYADTKVNPHDLEGRVTLFTPENEAPYGVTWSNGHYNVYYKDEIEIA